LTVSNCSFVNSEAYNGAIYNIANLAVSGC